MAEAERIIGSQNPQGMQGPEGAHGTDGTEGAHGTEGPDRPHGAGGTGGAGGAVGKDAQTPPGDAQSAAGAADGTELAGAADRTGPAGPAGAADRSEPAGATRKPAPAGATEGGAATDADARPRGTRKIVALFVVALVAYLLDLGSKLLVVAKLEFHPPVRILGDALQLTVIRNPGAAFGVGTAYTVIFTIIAAAVIAVIARLARKLYSLPWAIALGLLLGGALGNLTDRIFRSPGVFEGAVVDFIAPAHFAVFNLADSAITCGGILVVLLSFRGLDPDGTLHRN